MLQKCTKSVNGTPFDSTYDFGYLPNVTHTGPLWNPLSNMLMLPTSTLERGMCRCVSSNSSCTVNSTMLGSMTGSKSCIVASNTANCSSAPTSESKNKLIDEYSEPGNSFSTQTLLSMSTTRLSSSTGVLSHEMTCEFFLVVTTTRSVSRKTLKKPVPISPVVLASLLDLPL